MSHKNILLLLGGSQRSGTTVMQELLCQNRTHLPFLKESVAIRCLTQAYKETKTSFETSSCDYFDNLDSLTQFYAHAIDKIISSLENKHKQSTHLLFKEPHLTMYFPELHELLPNSRYILMIRDPRDVISSMLKVGENYLSNGLKHWFQERNIPLLCSHFRSFYSPALNFKNSNFKKRMAIIRYESLIEHPIQHLDLLRKHTQLELNDDNDKIPMDMTHPSSEQLWKTQLSGKPLSNTSIGNYKNYLKNHEIEIINRLLVDFMDLFQYVDRSVDAC